MFVLSEPEVRWQRIPARNRESEPITRPPHVLDPDPNPRCPRAATGTLASCDQQHRWVPMALHVDATEAELNVLHACPYNLE